MRKLLPLALVFFVLPAATLAQVSVIQVPSGAPDIQTAINQASAIINGPSPRDVLIEVAPGTYTSASQLNVNGINSPFFSVTLKSLQGPDATTIDLSNRAGFVMTGTATRNLVIDGFTIRNRIPNQDIFVGQGINLLNATGVTVQNCHFDTTQQAMFFRITDPALGARIQLVNNTAIAGQGSNPDAPDFVFGQAASVVTGFPVGTSPKGEIRFVVAHNVFRTTASSVRFINIPPDGSAIAFSNGSLEMTGNDLSSLATAGFNILGGHGHLVAGNRIHDGAVGGLFQLAVSGVIENNLIFNNAEHGLQLSGGPVSMQFPGEDRFIRHNTIVNNAGTGIVYLDFVGGRHELLPNVYNNIIAFNDAGGVAAVQQTPDLFAFIPVSFDLANNDNFGNTLDNFSVDFMLFSYVGISNPEIAAPDYSGVGNTGLDLSVDPDFRGPQNLDFSLNNDSPLIDAGITSRPTPFQDIAGNLRDSLPDIGAFEVVPQLGVPGKANARTNTRRK